MEVRVGRDTGFVMAPLQGLKYSSSPRRRKVVALSDDRNRDGVTTIQELMHSIFMTPRRQERKHASAEIRTGMLGYRCS